MRPDRTSAERCFSSHKTSEAALPSWRSRCHSGHAFAEVTASRVGRQGGYQPRRKPLRARATYVQYRGKCRSLNFRIISRGVIAARFQFCDTEPGRRDVNGGQRELGALISSVLLLSVGQLCLAQGETDSARAERHAGEEASLAKASQNPVANMVSLPFQYN